MFSTMLAGYHFRVNYDDSVVLIGETVVVSEESFVMFV